MHWTCVMVTTATLATLACGVDIDVQEDGPLAVGRRSITSPSLRARIVSRMQERNQARLSRKTVCYDMVGCFAGSNKPLQKAPESPSTVNTRFLLYTRDSPDPTVLRYGDKMNSLTTSTFQPAKLVKVIVHGFKGSGKDKGAILGATAFLNASDVNVVLVDWERGAAGPRYPTAVANTELVGRQLGLLLYDMIALGVPPGGIHLVGHSLGAHVAAVASQVLKDRGILVGRITGLDPASPLFKHQVVKDLTRKLDPSDAILVDVMHTDGSPVWTDGFGLLRPLGHVDFFPNGGREQPGCTDGRGSVVVSILEGTVNSSIVCSHVRAWRYFVESITMAADGQGCQFTAWPCHAGLPSFLQGHCFPTPGQCANGSLSCSAMGLHADKSTARGALYLVTRPESPYCGTQLRATVLISEKTQRTRGLLNLRLRHGGESTSFKINCEFLDVVSGGRLLWGLNAAAWGSIGPTETPELEATLGYQSLSHQATEELTPLNSPVYFDQLTIADQEGNSWYYCGKDTLLEMEIHPSFNQVNIRLTQTPC